MNSKYKRVSKLDTFFNNFLEKNLLFLILITVVLFVLWPVFCVIKESFIVEGKFTLYLYKSLFRDNKNLIYNSLFVGILSTILSTCISICISIYASFSNKKIRNTLIIILMITMISPPFVSSLAYINLFGRRGIITHYILRLTLNPYGWQGIVLMQAVSNVSLNSLLLIGIINGIDKNLLMASRDLGSSTSYAIRKVLIPIMMPGIMVVSLLSFISSIADFGTPMIIGGAFNVLATEVYMRVIAGADIAMASSISVLILIPALIVFIIYRIYMKKNKLKSEASVKLSSQNIEFKIQGFLGKLIFIVTFLFVLIMILQYGTIFLSSMSKYSRGKIQFTLEHFYNLKNYGLDSFTRSIIYSFITGILGSFLGIIIAYYTERRNITGMKTIDFISTLPYIIPGFFFGIGYILAFNKYPLELTGTMTIVVLNCIFKQLPMTTKTSSAVISQINTEIENAARDLGAKNIYVIKDIILPNVKTAFLIGFINNFTATMTTVGAIIFLVYPGQKVATLEMFDAIQTGNYGVGSAIASIIILSTLIINLIFSKLVLKGREFNNVSSAKRFS